MKHLSNSSFASYIISRLIKLRNIGRVIIDIFFKYKHKLLFLNEFRNGNRYHISFFSFSNIHGEIHISWTK